MCATATPGRATRRRWRLVGTALVGRAVVLGGTELLGGTVLLGGTALPGGPELLSGTVLLGRPRLLERPRLLRGALLRIVTRLGLHALLGMRALRAGMLGMRVAGPITGVAALLRHGGLILSLGGGTGGHNNVTARGAVQQALRSLLITFGCRT